jgi:uncharacterized membrane protein YgcG
MRYRMRLGEVGALCLLVGMMQAMVARAAAAAEPAVHDNAGFFNASAVQQANQLISQIRQQYHEDLLIETFPQIPSDMQASYDPQNKAAFFAQWARQRARDAGITGVYVLICRQPSYLDVDVGNRTRQRAFTLQNRDELRNILLTNFRQHNYDAGLLQAVQYAERTLHTNLTANSGQAIPAGGRMSPNQPSARGAASSWGWIVWLVIIVLVLWAVSRLFARRTAGYGPPTAGRGYGPGGYGAGYGPGGYGPGGYGPGGGGGWGRGLLGGLLGGALGGWLYDRWSGTGPTSTTPPPGAPGQETPPPGTDFGTGPGPDDLSGGGDFGTPPDAGAPPDAGGGGDFGGGGDVGGGDFGGGGDQGGRGGDFA